MLRPCARRARWYRLTLPSLLFTLLLLAGCLDSNATPTGNARANLPPSSGKPSATGAAAASSSQPATPPSDGLIPSAEMGAVYQQIVQRFIEPVDHATLVEAAIGAVHQVGMASNALPLDLAPVDLVPQPTGDPEDDWTAFARAYDLLVGKHPSWARETRPDRAVLQAMLDSLHDEGSMLVEASDTIRTGETRISGVGILMTHVDPADPPHVAEVYRNSPAAGAGLKLGDQIVAVDGTPTAGLSIPQVASMVRGPQGTAVVLSIGRGGQTPVDVRVTRGAFETPRVEALVRPDGFAVLRIRSFGDGDPQLIQQLLVRGQNSGVRGWIIDMRGNTGGSIESMAQVATNFVDSRPLAAATDRSGRQQVLQAPGRPAVPGLSFALVVDRGTSSWAEVLVAAVKEYQTGPVVGARTAGNVGIATQPLSDGSAFQLTVVKMQTPGGTPIGLQGVEPDVEATATVADLQRGDDVPIRRAVELLTSRPSNVQVLR
ncbi:MAG: S41 family peptidase [Chloroflexota bacterium]